MFRDLFIKISISLIYLFISKQDRVSTEGCSKNSSFIKHFINFHSKWQADGNQRVLLKKKKIKKLKSRKSTSNHRDRDKSWLLKWVLKGTKAHGSLWKTARLNRREKEQRREPLGNSPFCYSIWCLLQAQGLSDSLKPQWRGERSESYPSRSRCFNLTRKDQFMNKSFVRAKSF